MCVWIKIETYFDDDVGRRGVRAARWHRDGGVFVLGLALWGGVFRRTTRMILDIEAMAPGGVVAMERVSRRIPGTERRRLGVRRRCDMFTVRLAELDWRNLLTTPRSARQDIHGPSRPIAALKSESAQAPWIANSKNKFTVFLFCQRVNPIYRVANSPRQLNNYEK